jgi:hypothetical protein
VSIHILTKTADDSGFAYALECPGRPDCEGWQECQEKHVVDGRDASEGPYDCDDDAPWFGQDEFEFHGVRHMWGFWGDYWMSSFVGCVVRAHSYLRDEAAEVLDGKPAGRYLVRDHWDEDEMTLEFVGPENGEKP